MSDRPISLKVADIESAIVESVEIAVEERTVAENTASAPNDPAFAAYAVLEPSISGFLPCE